jgi:3-hydroxy-D-aspartate aldolase
MNINEIETPALILDKDLFLTNINTMEKLLADTSMKLRPHYKTHRCPQIAQLQIMRGAEGITCSKLGEALDLADAGIANILIANQIVQKSKIKTLAKLASRCYLTVCVDNEDNLRELSAAAKEAQSTIHCLVEFEVGMKRCGVETYEEAHKLAALSDSLPNLKFDGIQAYAGHMAHETDLDKRTEETSRIETLITGLKRYLTDRGLAVREVGGGSTGTVELKKKDSVYTDIQAGSYIFMDSAYRKLNLSFKNSLYVFSTVISTKKSCVVTDIGVKSLGMDQGNPIPLGVPDNAEISFSEEHSAIYFENHAYKINDKIRYIPGHCCTTVNMFDKIHVISGDEVIDIWPVASRGKSQ